MLVSRLKKEVETLDEVSVSEMLINLADHIITCYGDYMATSGVTHSSLCSRVIYMLPRPSERIARINGSVLYNN